MPLILVVAIVTMLTASFPKLSYAEPEYEVSDLLGRAALPIRPNAGIVLQIDITRSTILNQDQIHKRLKSIEGLPEHPDRSLLTANQALLEAPEVSSVLLAWLDWTHFAASEIIDLPGGVSSTVQVAANGPTRWLLAEFGEGGQLSITHSDVPFPSGYDCTPVLNRWKSIALLATGGFLIEGKDAKVIDGKWGALDPGINFFVLRIGDHTDIRIDIRTLVAGETVLSRVRTYSVDDSDQVLQDFRFDNYKWDDATRRNIPESVSIVDFTIGQRTDVQVRHIDRVTNEEIAQMLDTPAPETLSAEVQVADFDGTGSGLQSRYQGVPRVRWSYDEGEDRFDYTEVVQAWMSTQSSLTPRKKQTRLFVSGVVFFALVAGTGFYLIFRTRAAR